jgi:hypothetical protein
MTPMTPQNQSAMSHRCDKRPRSSHHTQDHERMLHSTPDDIEVGDLEGRCKLRPPSKPQREIL